MKGMAFACARGKYHSNSQRRNESPDAAGTVADKKGADEKQLSGAEKKWLWLLYGTKSSCLEDCQKDRDTLTGAELPQCQWCADQYGNIDIDPKRCCSRINSNN